MYLVMKLCKWEDTEFDTNVRLPFPMQLKAAKGEVGYLLVFDDCEEALEFAGDPNLIVEIKLI